MREGKKIIIAYLYETDGCGQIECAVSKGVKCYLIKSFGARRREKKHKMQGLSDTTG